MDKIGINHGHVWQPLVFHRLWARQELQSVPPNHHLSFLDSVWKVLLLTCFNISGSQFPCGTKVDPDEFTLASEKKMMVYAKLEVHRNDEIEIIIQTCFFWRLKAKKTLL